MERLVSRVIIMLQEDATNFGRLLKANFNDVHFYQTTLSPSKKLSEIDEIYEYDKRHMMLTWYIRWHADDWKPNWESLKDDDNMYRVVNEYSVSAFISYYNDVSKGQNRFSADFEYFFPLQATASYLPDDKNAVAIARKFIRLVEKGGSRWDVLVDMATLQPFGEPTKKHRPVSWPAARQSCITHPHRFLGLEFDPEQQKTFGYKPVEWLEHIKG